MAKTAFGELNTYAQEANIENCLTSVVIVGVELQVFEHVVRKSLHDICTVKL